MMMMMISGLVGNGEREFSNLFSSQAKFLNPSISSLST